MHDGLELAGLAHLNNLLAKVIAELVSHGVSEGALQSVDQGGHKVLRQILGLLQLLLDHAATSLVVCQLLGLLDYLLLRGSQRVGGRLGLESGDGAIRRALGVVIE